MNPAVNQQISAQSRFKATHSAIALDVVLAQTTRRTILTRLGAGRARVNAISILLMGHETPRIANQELNNGDKKALYKKLQQRPCRLRKSRRTWGDGPRDPDAVCGNWVRLDAARLQEVAVRCESATCSATAIVTASFWSAVGCCPIVVDCLLGDCLLPDCLRTSDGASPIGWLSFFMRASKRARAFFQGSVVRGTWHLP